MKNFFLSLLFFGICYLGFSQSNERKQVYSNKKDSLGIISIEEKKDKPVQKNKLQISAYKNAGTRNDISKHPADSTMINTKPKNQSSLKNTQPEKKSK